MHPSDNVVFIGGAVVFGVLSALLWWSIFTNKSAGFRVAVAAITMVLIYLTNFLPNPPPYPDSLAEVVKLPAFWGPVMSVVAIVSVVIVTISAMLMPVRR